LWQQTQFLWFSFSFLPVHLFQLKKPLSVIQTSAHAVAIDCIVRHATLDTPRGSSGYGTDRCALFGALFTTYDGAHGRSAHTATHCAANCATT
jgi:hypothetical protein